MEADGLCYLCATSTTGGSPCVTFWNVAGTNEVVLCPSCQERNCSCECGACEQPLEAYANIVVAKATSADDTHVLLCSKCGWSQPAEVASTLVARLVGRTTRAQREALEVIICRFIHQSS